MCFINYNYNKKYSSYVLPRRCVLVHLFHTQKKATLEINEASLFLFWIETEIEVQEGTTRIRVQMC